MTNDGPDPSRDRILVVNAGSSSLKLRVLGAGDAVVASADLPAPRGATDAGAIESAIAGFGSIGATGHRIVHGGTRYAGPVRLDATVEADLRARGQSVGDVTPDELERSWEAAKAHERKPHAP